MRIESDSHIGALLAMAANGIGLTIPNLSDPRSVRNHLDTCWRTLLTNKGESAHALRLQLADVLLAPCKPFDNKVAPGPRTRSKSRTRRSVSRRRNNNKQATNPQEKKKPELKLPTIPIPAPNAGLAAQAAGSEMTIDEVDMNDWSAESNRGTDYDHIPGWVGPIPAATAPAPKKKAAPKASRAAVEDQPKHNLLVHVLSRINAGKPGNSYCARIEHQLRAIENSGVTKDRENPTTIICPDIGPCKRVYYNGKFNFISEDANDVFDWNEGTGRLMLEFLCPKTTCAVCDTLHGKNLRRNNRALKTTRMLVLAQHCLLGMTEPNEDIYWPELEKALVSGKSAN